MKGIEGVRPLGLAARVGAVAALITAGLASVLMSASPSGVQAQTTVGSNFALTDKGGRDATVSWDNPGGATSITLTRIGNVSGSTTTSITPLTATSQNVSLATGDLVACWFLIAQPGNAISDPLCLFETVPVTTDVRPATVGAAATNLRLRLGQSTTATLDWDRAAGASSELMIELGGEPTEVRANVTSPLTDVIAATVRCYELLSNVDSAVAATNILCGVAGFSTIPSGPPPPTATPTPTPCPTVPIINICLAVPPTNTPGGVTNTPTATGTPAATSTATPVPGPADLTVAKSAPATANQNDTLIYTITVTNSGGADAANVLVNDQLSAGVTFQNAGPISANCNHVSGTVTCLPGTLAANGGSVTITIVVRVDACVSPQVNSVGVSTASAEPNSANNAASASTTISGCPTTTPTLTATATSTLTPTRTATVTRTPTATTVPGTFSGVLTAQVISGRLDINGDGVADAKDTSDLLGTKGILNGFVDCNLSGAIDASDDCPLIKKDGTAFDVLDGVLALPNGPLPLCFNLPAVCWNVISGRVDVNGDGVIDTNDDHFAIITGINSIVDGLVDVDYSTVITTDGNDSCSNNCFFGRNVVHGVIQG